MVYSEKVTLEREERREDEEKHKVYVKVVAEFTPDGRLRPLTVTWKDGRVYEIDRVMDSRRAATLKGGGMGIRYLCEVCGQQIHLFYEENYRWFLVPRGA